MARSIRRLLPPDFFVGATDHSVTSEAGDFQSTLFLTWMVASSAQALDAIQNRHWIKEMWPLRRGATAYRDCPSAHLSRILE